MATRKPASVLPEPVGAATSVLWPAAMSGQPASCGGVGPSGNRRRNQVATAGWNESSASPAARPARPRGTATATSGVDDVDHPPIVTAPCDNEALPVARRLGDGPRAVD